MGERLIALLGLDADPPVPEPVVFVAYDDPDDDPDLYDDECECSADDCQHRERP